jgi:hypothetical protein
MRADGAHPLQLLGHLREQQLPAGQFPCDVSGNTDDQYSTDFFSTTTVPTWTNAGTSTADPCDQGPRDREEHRTGLQSAQRVDVF